MLPNKTRLLLSGFLLYLSIQGIALDQIGGGGVTSILMNEIYRNVQKHYIALQNRSRETPKMYTCMWNNWQREKSKDRQNYGCLKMP